MVDPLRFDRELRRRVLPWAPLEDGEPCCTPVAHVVIRALSVRFGGVAAVHNVDMVIPRGCVTSIVGPSGCGKSTLLSAINRMTDTSSDCRVDGSIRIDGLEVTDQALDVRALRRRVGLVAQRPNPLPLSIEDNIALPLKDHGVRSRAERAERVERALRDVSLWGEVAQRLRRPAALLSGGQQQRLCVARCLALEPEIVLMDEPCSALDPLSSGDMEELIAGLRNRVTVVLVTHNLAQARRVADFTALLWQRKYESSLVEYGRTHQFFENPCEKLTSLYVSGLTG